jgi:SAM-dependent methyltransferase
MKTSGTANQNATTEDFEFAALQEAANYRAALLSEFRESLRGHVLEVGAGIGQFTEALLREPGIKRLTSVEPAEHFARKLRDRLPACEVIEGTIEQVPAAWPLDAILSINVLEHIEADERELGIYRQRLAANRGRLCLFVPARPEIFGLIDRDFGHFRRYTRPGLKLKLENAGFRIKRLVYFNLAGYFAWWWAFRILKKRHFEIGQVRFFDRHILPLEHSWESRILRPPIGQSLLVLAQAS